MTLKIHGHAASSSTRRVLLVCKEKKIPYELISIDWIVGQHRQPEWRQFHPFNEIPYIDDNGFILYESRAIARYLAAAYPADGPALVIPTSADVKAHALFEQALAVEVTKLDPTITGILTERMVKPFLGQTSDEVVVAALLKKLETMFEGYERILSKSKYMTGEEITLADLFHVPYLSLFTQARINVLTDEEQAKKWPNVKRWATDILSRESSKAVELSFD